MTVLHYLFTCYILLCGYSEGARILAVFPIPSFSHQVVFRALTQELARRGHDVVVITPDPVFTKEKPPANLTEIDVHDISYSVWGELFMKASKGNKNDLAVQMEISMKAILTIFEIQLKDERVQKILNDKSQKFDLVFTEASVRSAMIIAHIYKAPLILISSLGALLDNYAAVGAPTHPFLYPALTRQKLNNLTLWDKAIEFYNTYGFDQTYAKMKSLEHEMLKRNFGEDAPSIDELNKYIDMLFLNVHPIFEGIRPVPPNVIFMGGIHQKPEQPLPNDLKEYLDSSKHGVIYISFGTNVDPSLLPKEKIQTFIQAFSELPYDVLWKWNKDVLPGKTDNIRISKWLPQSDLLKHPKIKLFITQGGLQSTDEAITAGVPLLGMPMLGDQWYNVEKYEYHGIGLGIDMETLNKEELVTKIKTMIADERYRDNFARIRTLLRDEPMRPLDRAVWWTEYVLRHKGAKHLRSPAANISWAQYLELELVFTVLAVLTAFGAVALMALWYMYQVIMNVRGVKVKRS